MDSFTLALSQKCSHLDIASKVEKVATRVPMPFYWELGMGREFIIVVQVGQT